MSAERHASNSESNSQRELRMVSEFWDNLYVYDVELSHQADVRQIPVEELLREKQSEIQGLLQQVKFLNFGTFFRWHESLLSVPENEVQILQHLRDFPTGAFAQLLLEVAALQDEREDNVDDRNLIRNLRNFGFEEHCIPDLVEEIQSRKLFLKKQVQNLQHMYDEASSWMRRIRYSRN